MNQARDLKRRIRTATFRTIGMIAILAAGAVAADARARPAAHRPPIAASAFDGRWSVLIETARGACGRSYRVGLDIVNGVVTYEGNAYGRVAADGRVRVHLAIGDQRADGGGRLFVASGAGLWRGAGSSGACAGRWLAERRD